MDNIEAQSSEEIDNFLRSIPQDSRRETLREQKFWPILNEVERQLDIPEDERPEWLSQLAELDFGDYSNDVESISIVIARSLTSYALNRPWVLNSFLARPTQPHDIVSDSTPESDSHNNGSILGYESLADIKARNELTGGSDAEMNRISIIVAGENYLNTSAKNTGITANSDAVLGLAGYRPSIREPRFGYDMELILLRSLASRSLEIEHEFTSQYRNHVELTGDSSRRCAKISFLPNINNAEDDAKMGVVESRVGRGITNLKSQIDNIQGYGTHVDQIPFLRFASVGEESGTSVTEPYYVEIASIHMETFRELARAYEKARETFEHAIDRSDPGSQSRSIAASSPKELTDLEDLIGQKLKEVSPDNLSQYSAPDRLSGGTAESLELSTLKGVLGRIFNDLGITLFYDEAHSPRTAPEVLHETALAVQSVTLILQSYLRRSTTPFNFEFLTSPISDFILDGASSLSRGQTVLTNSLSRGQTIHASSQRLSCLGDMLREEVLVFGVPKGSFPEIRLDLVATPVQIGDIWGPAELIIWNGSTAVMEGPASTQHDSQTSPLASHGMSIVGIRIQGGIITPSDESVCGIQMWHWRPINVTEENDSRLFPNIHTGIDFDTRIRIGGIKESRLNLHPIGPANWNKDCPHSSDCDFSISNEFLSSSLRVTGTKDPSFEMQSVTVGAQGGQILNLVSQATLARTAGRTVKDQALESVGLFDVQLAGFERMWGLFVSLCTGVMTRVRLRELVAFFYLGCSPMEIPRLPGKTDEESLDAFAQAMFGDCSLIAWAESLIPDAEKNKIQVRNEYREHILSLFRKVLGMLKGTGISENGDLILACLSDGKALETLALSARDHPWIKVLSDSSLTATFACISPHCFQTSDCACRKAGWGELPKEFRLSTKLDRFTPHLGERDAENKSLRVAKSYWINSVDLSLLAKVNDFIKLSDSESYYYITIKKCVIPFALLKHVAPKPTLREDDSETAVDCIIGNDGLKIPAASLEN